MVLKLSLTLKQKDELTQTVLTHPKPYMRERAGALLKLHSGMSGVEIAFSGLLIKRRKNTVYDWVHRYQAEGISGLFIKKGRGCKPSFSPLKP